MKVSVILLLLPKLKLVHTKALALCALNAARMHDKLSSISMKSVMSLLFRQSSKILAVKEMTRSQIQF